MGRLMKLRDLTAQQDIISGATYGPADELTSMSGSLTETRRYNALVQLKLLTSSTAVSGSNKSFQYRYSATQNNGKITSQYYTDPVSAEEVTYTYDALNRLVSATATDLSWGQSYNYDGFGNLTDQTTTHGSTPELHVTYNAATNRQTGDCADANGNLYPAPGCAGGVYYDVENRITSPASQNQWQYSYAPGTQRVWR